MRGGGGEWGGWEVVIERLGERKGSEGLRDCVCVLCVCDTEKKGGCVRGGGGGGGSDRNGECVCVYA